MEEIIRSAIEGTYQTRNLKLKPISKKSSRNLRQAIADRHHLDGIDE
jgi:hypothetical protein